DALTLKYILRRCKVFDRYCFLTFNAQRGLWYRFNGGNITAVLRGNPKIVSGLFASQSQYSAQVIINRFLFFPRIPDSQFVWVPILRRVIKHMFGRDYAATMFIP